MTYLEARVLHQDFLDVAREIGEAYLAQEYQRYERLYGRWDPTNPNMPEPHLGFIPERFNHRYAVVAESPKFLFRKGKHHVQISDES